MEINIKVVQSPPESDMAGSLIAVGESGATIGRAATNTMALPDPNRYVSSLHARIQFNGEHFEIIDQSTNGTFLNNLSQALVKGQPRAIAHGDQILMGPFVLEVAVVGADIGGDSTSVTSELEDTTSLTIPPNDAEIGMDDLDRWLEPNAQQPEPLPRLKPAASAEDDSLISPVNKELDPLAALGNNSAKDENHNINFGIGEGDWNAAQGELPNAGELGGQRMDIPGMIPTDWDKSLVVPAGKKPTSPDSLPAQSPRSGLADHSPDPDALEPRPDKSAPAGGEGNSLLDLVNTPSEQLKIAAPEEDSRQDVDDNKFVSDAREIIEPEKARVQAPKAADDMPLDETGFDLNSPEGSGFSKPPASDQSLTADKPELAIDPTDSQVGKHLSDWLDIPEPEPLPKLQDEGRGHAPAANQHQQPAEDTEGKIVTNKPGENLFDPPGSDLEPDSLSELLGGRVTSGEETPKRGNPVAGNPVAGNPVAGSPVAKRRTTGKLQVPPAAPGEDSLIDFFSGQPSEEVCKPEFKQPVKTYSPAIPPTSEKSEKGTSQTFTAGDVRLVRQLAEGMGLTGLSEQELNELIPVVAKFVLITVEGLMGALRARQTIKNEFRMNLTIIQAVENNPLKFSLSTEDAIENLFVKKRKAYLSATEAAGEAFADIADHQLALFNGIRFAYDELMEQFSPERLEKRFERQRGKSLFGGSGKKWEAYHAFIEELNEDQERTFKHLFGEIFAEQYEKSFENLKAKRRK